MDGTRQTIIAVDFDGCLCENAWPDIGEAKQDVIDALLSRQKAGAKIILWTCRVGERLDAAIQWCQDHGIFFDAVNANLPVNIAAFGNDCRKVFADEYWDDKAFLPQLNTDFPLSAILVAIRKPEIRLFLDSLLFTEPDVERAQVAAQEAPASHKTEHCSVRWDDPYIPTDEQNANTHINEESATPDSLKQYRIACAETLINEHRQCRLCYIRLRRQALLRHPLRLLVSIYWLHQRNARRKRK